MAKKAGNTFKLGIPQWAKPIVNVVRKVAEPVVKELVKSPPAKALFKALPQVVSPVSKSGSTGNKKITSTPKTVQPAKSVPAKAQNSSKKEVKGTACNNIKPLESGTAAQVNLQNNNNIKLSWEEMLQMYLDAVRKGETLTGAVRSLAVMSSPTLSQYDRTLKLSKIISLGAELTGAKNYYNKAAESIKGNFNDLGNQVYNAKIPFASNFVGAFTNSSDYKENGPLPLETQAENRLLAGLNYLQYSKFGGGILNHADPLTTYNSIRDNTNMSSVIGANTGGFFINGAAKMADGMANICLDPYGTLEGLINLAANPKETFETVSKGIETFSFHMVGADSQEKARLQGNILFDIASIVLFSQMGKAAEGTKGAQGANEAGGLAKRGVSINKTEAEMANASRSAGGPGVAEGLGGVFDKGKKVFDNFNVDGAYVKPKHLSTTSGNARQFIGETKADAEIILKDAMNNGTITSIVDDGVSAMGNQKYKIIIDAGKTIGTRGESLIEIILSDDGGMLSAFPIS